MTTVPEPVAARQMRSEQILSAAGTLLLRHGYQRITMEDVAREAGVGTGTLYLHWKTKEALFETVLLRELVTLWSHLVQRLDADPADALLHRFLGNLLHAIRERPLAQALFTRDSALLGKLARRSVVVQAQPLTSGAQLIATLRELGLMRSDVPLDVQAYSFSAIWAGFSLVDPLLVGADRVSLDIQVEALTHSIRRTFEPDSPPDAVVLRTHVVPALRAFLDQARTSIEQHIEARMLLAR
ncbi:MAG: TetR/AcrR family transcriptional regulator [Deltaproteobacteria bacterium]|nr:TetR/AcrR family transcriptional regulator [Deltaproteobacteria bacterium]